MKSGRREVSAGRRWFFFLCLIVLSLAAEGQFLESIFSTRRSHDDGSSSDFVDGTSKHFLSMLFAPFDNKPSGGGIREGGGGGGMFTLFGQPSRSGSVNYENYRSPQSYSTYDGTKNAYYPARPDDDYETGAYTCKGCDKGATHLPIKEVGPVGSGSYQCRGCAQDHYPSYSSQSESYRSPKRHQEFYELPKHHHHHPQYHVIDTKLRVPPIKFRLHLSPKITIKTNAQDPLERKPKEDHEDYIPPEVHAHHHHHHHGHHGFAYYHPKRDGSGIHIEEPYGAQFIKHQQPIKDKYDPTFRIKIDPEIYTDPPPTPPPRSTTTTSSSRLQARPSRQSSRTTTTTTTTTTAAPTISSNARSAIDSLREASESGLSPLEALLRRRGTTSTTTTEEAPKAGESTMVTSSILAETTSVLSSSTASEREVEETTLKTSAVTENISNNEVSVDAATPTTPFSEKLMETTQDPREAILKLREAAESGRSPFEALLSTRRAPTNDRKLIPRNSEKN